MCCSGGKVEIKQIAEPPQPLKELLTLSTETSRHFVKNIRRYNTAFQMTSFGANIINQHNFMPTFKVQGQIYHRIGSLMPIEGEAPQFLQLYFVSDFNEQAEKRVQFSGTRIDIILNLQQMLHEKNSYIRDFKYALECQPQSEYKIIIDPEKKPAGHHRGRFNAPQTNEIAAIVTGEEHGKRDIVIHHRGTRLQRITETHRSYDPLQYPLICVHGEEGYHFGIAQVNPIGKEPLPGKKVSCMQFYAYHFMIRDNQFNLLQRCGDLFHQYAVDMYAKVESERLLFIRTHQRQLRADSYIHLRDAICNDGTQAAANVGQLCILPSSFTGSPRYMHERTQDALTYVKHYGRPQLFITITCNPNWEEIKRELFPGQTPQQRHDLIARVFRQKLIKLMHIIKKGEIFGQVRCDMYTIEWQKRGLPHAHILIWLCDKIHMNQIDSLISAELPNPVEDSMLFEIVTTQMVHGPCGAINPNAQCMNQGKCTKKFPRNFLHETQAAHDGYPLYRRRKPAEGGFTGNKKLPGGQEYQIDNRWIVPYCPLLSKIFIAHINVEFCNSVKAIKYICKYVNKGSDAAMFGLQSANSNDEIAQFLMGRYISSNEAVWRILEFPLHERHPAIIHLSVHLENGQRVISHLQRQHNKCKLQKAQHSQLFSSFVKQMTLERLFSTHKYPHITHLVVENGVEENMENAWMDILIFEKMLPLAECILYIQNKKNAFTFDYCSMRYLGQRHSSPYGLLMGQFVQLIEKRA